MSREDYVWVGMRLFGLWLAILALGSALEVIGSGINLYVWTERASSEFEDTRESADRALAYAEVGAAIGSVKLLAYLSAAWYLLRRGQGLLGWLSPRARTAGPSA